MVEFDLTPYLDRIYGYAVKRTYSREEAEELSQEIVLAALPLCHQPVPVLLVPGVKVHQLGTAAGACFMVNNGCPAVLVNSAPDPTVFIV